MRCHLVILKKPYLESILSGEKTIELRLTRARRPACGGVATQDQLLLKTSGGPVCGRATVLDVECYEDLTPEGIAGIRRHYGQQIGGDDAVWESMMDCTSGLLIRLTDVRRIEAIRIDKKDCRAWVLLREGKDFGLLGRIREDDLSGAR
ncbi:MAG: ASCH domain-containing protein [Solirubrobacterales bacterium]